MATAFFDELFASTVVESPNVDPDSALAALIHGVLNNDEAAVLEAIDEGVDVDEQGTRRGGGNALAIHRQTHH